MEKLLKYCIFFEGETRGLKKIQVKKEIEGQRWNKQLPVPLKPGEVVYVHPDQLETKPGYIKIVQEGDDYKIVTVFNRGIFIFD